MTDMRTGLTDEECKEIHQMNMQGMGIYFATGMFANILAFAWRPFWPGKAGNRLEDHAPEGVRSALTAVNEGVNTVTAAAQQLPFIG